MRILLTLSAGFLLCLFSVQLSAQSCNAYFGVEEPTSGTIFHFVPEIGQPDDFEQWEHLWTVDGQVFSWMEGTNTNSDFYYEFLMQGEREVCHTVYNGACEHTFCWSFYFDPADYLPCNVQIEYELDETTGQLDFGFNHEELDAQYVAWLLSDGQDWDTPNGTFYLEYGTYTLCLVLPNSNNCAGEYCIDIVYEEPQCEPQIQLNTFGGNEYYFNAYGVSAQGGNFEWFLNGEFFSELQSDFVALDDGTYTLCLLYTGEDGCVGETCVDFVVQQETFCPQDIVVIDLGQGGYVLEAVGGNPDAFLFWTLGDEWLEGNPVTVQVPANECVDYQLWVESFDPCEPIEGTLCYETDSLDCNVQLEYELNPDECVIELFAWGAPFENDDFSWYIGDQVYTGSAISVPADGLSSIDVLVFAQNELCAGEAIETIDINCSTDPCQIDFVGQFGTCFVGGYATSNNPDLDLSGVFWEVWHMENEEPVYFSGPEFSFESLDEGFYSIYAGFDGQNCIQEFEAIGYVDCGDNFCDFDAEFYLDENCNLVGEISNINYPEEDYFWMVNGQTIAGTELFWTPPSNGNFSVWACLQNENCNSDIPSSIQVDCMTTDACEVEFYTYVQNCYMTGYVYDATFEGTYTWFVNGEFADDGPQFGLDLQQNGEYTVELLYANGICQETFDQIIYVNNCEDTDPCDVDIYAFGDGCWIGGWAQGGDPNMSYEWSVNGVEVQYNASGFEMEVDQNGEYLIELVYHGPNCEDQIWTEVVYITNCGDVSPCDVEVSTFADGCLIGAWTQGGSDGMIYEWSVNGLQVEYNQGGFEMEVDQNGEYVIELIYHGPDCQDQVWTEVVLVTDCGDVNPCDFEIEVFLNDSCQIEGNLFNNGDVVTSDVFWILQVEGQGFNYYQNGSDLSFTPPVNGTYNVIVNTYVDNCNVYFNVPVEVSCQDACAYDYYIYEEGCAAYGQLILPPNANAEVQWSLDGEAIWDTEYFAADLTEEISTVSVFGTFGQGCTIDTQVNVFNTCAGTDSCDFELGYSFDASGDNILLFATGNFNPNIDGGYGWYIGDEYFEDWSVQIPTAWVIQNGMPCFFFESAICYFNDCLEIELDQECVDFVLDMNLPNIAGIDAELNIYHEGEEFFSASTAAFENEEVTLCLEDGCYLIELVHPGFTLNEQLLLLTLLMEGVELDLSALDISFLPGSTTIVMGVNEEISNCTSGIASLEMAELSVYPVPFQENITLQYDAWQNATVVIHDMSGRLLLSETLQSSQTVLQTGDWANGVYVLTVQSAAGTLHKTIVK